MSSKTALRTAGAAALLAVLAALWGTNSEPARAQGRADAPKAAAPADKPGADAPQADEPADDPARPLSADEKAILAADEAFEADYNKGDSKALAARFTEDAEVVQDDGDRYTGRARIERRLAETFKEHPGVKMDLKVDDVRFVAPDVAKEEGRTLMTTPEGEAVSRRYTALYVRRDGHWLIASVREEEDDTLVRPHERLKALDWMLGDWMDEGAESEVRLHCDWSEDKNFLIRKFTVKRAGKPVMTVTQRIGWDPLARQFRSWEFDSEGGFGEGLWSRDGDRWVVDHAGVRPDGTTGEALNVMVRERPDLVRWASTERTVDGAPADEELKYVLVRVPPKPKPASANRPAEAPAPKPNTPPSDNERSPR